MTRTKRRLEKVVTLVSLLLITATVATYLYLILQGRSPPTELVVLALVGIAGAIGSTYKIEDVRKVLELLQR